MNSESNVKKTLVRLCTVLAAAGCLFSFAGCAGGTVSDASAIDASLLSFEPTVYYARNGRIRFMYDSETDMLSAPEGYDMAALYAGSVYSMVFSYTEGILTRAEADAAVKAEFDAGDVMALSSKSKAVQVDGHTFRRAEITCSDGSVGAVLYGSTETGFAEIYYLLSPDAGEDAAAHVEEILSTVRLTEFEGDTDDVQKIFAE